jgi:hypothetical protein
MSKLYDEKVLIKTACGCSKIVKIPIGKLAVEIPIEYEIPLPVAKRGRLASGCSFEKEIRTFNRTFKYNENVTANGLRVFEEVVNWQ